MAHSVKVRISWILLILVCFLWFLDCTTRPEADPFIVRIGNLVIDLSPEKSEESFIYRIGSWLVSFGSNKPATDSSDGSTSIYNATISSTTTINSLSSSKHPLVGKWKMTDLRDPNGNKLDLGGTTSVVEFFSNGTVRATTTSESGASEMHTQEWMTDGSYLYITTESVLDDDADRTEYSVRGDTLTITDNGYSLIYTRVK